MQVSQIEKNWNFLLCCESQYFYLPPPRAHFSGLSPLFVYDCAINVNFVHWDQFMHLYMHLTMLYCKLLSSFTENVKRGLIKAFID